MFDKDEIREMELFLVSAIQSLEGAVELRRRWLWCTE